MEALILEFPMLFTGLCRWEGRDKIDKNQCMSHPARLAYDETLPRDFEIRPGKEPPNLESSILFLKVHRSVG